MCKKLVCCGASSKITSHVATLRRFEEISDVFLNFPETWHCTFWISPSVPVLYNFLSSQLADSALNNTLYIRQIREGGRGDLHALT